MESWSAVSWLDVPALGLGMGPTWREAPYSGRGLETGPCRPFRHCLCRRPSLAAHCHCVRGGWGLGTQYEERGADDGGVPVVVADEALLRGACPGDVLLLPAVPAPIRTSLASLAALSCLYCGYLQPVLFHFPLVGVPFIYWPV